MDARTEGPLDSPVSMRRSPVSLAAALALAVLAAGCAPDSSGRGGRGPRTPSTPGPVFLLGFDGLDPGLVERLEAEGALPNFARLRAEGAVGVVHSTLPFISPPAWATVATGVPPADHGVWSFWIPSPENPRGRFVDAACRLAKPFWLDLSEAGRTVGIVDVPLTSPPDAVNGFMVGGFPYPKDAALTFPPELEADLVARGYLRDAFNGPPRPGHEGEWLDEMTAMARARRTIGLGLLFERRPDLSMIVFTLPDRVQHHLWRFHDPAHPLHRADSPEKLRSAVRDAYVWCDEILGEVRGTLRPGETLFVFSDHGFGPAYEGISKERVLASLPASIRAKRARGVNLFGGDFYLDGSTREERAALVDALLALTDEKGRKLVRAAHDLVGTGALGLGGPLGPAVFAEEAEGFLFVPGDESAPLVGALEPTSFSGYHRRDGYFGAIGHPIQPGPVRAFDLQDVPAMTMHLLGEPIPRRFVQNLPRRLFPTGYFVERPMSYSGAPRDGLRAPAAAGAADDSTAAGPAPDEGIREQLESLGYVR